MPGLDCEGGRKGAVDGARDDVVKDELTALLCSVKIDMDLEEGGDVVELL